MRLNLKLFRVSHDLTQEEIAEKIGVSRVTYYNVESGNRGGQLDVFWKNFQEAFDIPDSEMYNIMKLKD